MAVVRAQIAPRIFAVSIGSCGSTSSRILRSRTSDRRFSMIFQPGISSSSRTRSPERRSTGFLRVFKVHREALVGFGFA